MKWLHSIVGHQAYDDTRSCVVFDFAGSWAEEEFRNCVRRALKTVACSTMELHCTWDHVVGLPTITEANADIAAAWLRRLCGQRKIDGVLGVVHHYSADRKFLALSCTSKLCCVKHLHDIATTAVRMYADVVKSSVFLDFSGDACTQDTSSDRAHIARVLASYYVLLSLFAGRAAVVDVLGIPGEAALVVRHAELHVRNAITLGDVSAAACDVLNGKHRITFGEISPRAGFLCSGVGSPRGCFRLGRL